MVDRLTPAQKLARAVISLLILACAVTGASFEWGWPVGLLVAAGLLTVELVT